MTKLQRQARQLIRDCRTTNPSSVFSRWWSGFAGAQGRQPLPVKSLAERAFRAGWSVVCHRWYHNYLWQHKIVNLRQLAEYRELCHDLHTKYEGWGSNWSWWWDREVAKNHITAPSAVVEKMARLVYHYATRRANDKFRDHWLSNGLRCASRNA